jgi:hypothetical protein
MTTIPAGFFDFLMQESADLYQFRFQLGAHCFLLPIEGFQPLLNQRVALKGRLDLTRQGLHFLRTYQFVFPAWKKHAQGQPLPKQRHQYDAVDNIR